MMYFKNSSYIWADRETPERNAFVSFEKRFQRPADGSLFLHLFADTRFRLWVNESFVGYGPARFVMEFPEYDSYDIADLLVDGENLVRVEVNYYGCNSYQSMPEGLPGFIAGGESADGSVNFETPGRWTARVHAAWRSDAPLFSFAQNPAEICDTRILKDELGDPCLSVAVRCLSGVDRPWGALAVRSVPYSTYWELDPQRLEIAGPLEPSDTYGFQSVASDFTMEGIKLKRAFSTFLYSPRSQEIRLGCFWSDLRLNGEVVVVDTDTLLGNHGEVVLQLDEGWNSLVGVFEVLLEYWSYLLCLPDGCGVSLHAVPSLDMKKRFALSSCERTFLVEDVRPVQRVEALPEGWTLNEGNIEALTPSRVMAWDIPAEEQAVRMVDWKDFSAHASLEGREVSWCFSFEKEYYGHPVLDVEAPEGAILDVVYDDWQRKDGYVNLYCSNPFADTADRFILQGGKQKIQILNPRGGIFLQVTLRVPEGHAEATLALHDLTVQQRTTILEVEGDFKAGNADFDYAWTAGVNTLQASTDDAYSDCPWRERGSYIGDGLVGLHLDTLSVSDLRVARRTFLNWGRAALPDGQLACCSPAWLRKPHEDFSLLWIIGVRDYWSMTGDVAFIRENWEALQGVLAAAFEEHVSGLWNTTGRRLFIDWGVLPSDQEGDANGAINILRVAALRASAQMARVVGFEDEAARYLAEAEVVEKALFEVLWDASEGRFLPSLSHGGIALHANIWALCFEVGPTQQILDYIEPHLQENLQRGLEKGQYSGHVELYFLYYILPRLADLGRADLAEQLIEEHYGFLRGLGVATLNECFCRAHRKVGSCCHTWSSAGAIYAHRYVLGLRQVEAGNPDRWILDPCVTDRFSTVEGVLPHLKGSIRVAWSRSDGGIAAKVSAPEGVSVVLGEGLYLAS